MVNIYYSFFYQHLTYGLEFWSCAADCSLEEVYLLLGVGKVKSHAYKNLNQTHDRASAIALHY